MCLISAVVCSPQRGSSKSLVFQTMPPGKWYVEEKEEEVEEEGGEKKEEEEEEDKGEREEDVSIAQL